MAKTKLKCPSCGWDGSRPGSICGSFVHLEKVMSIRDVIGVRADGVLEVEARERTAVEHGGEGPWLGCGDCVHEFPIPKGMKIEFS
jgi:hypothetical protein